MSYAHRDEKQTDGRISQLREALQLAVSSVIGEDFEIFQDCDAIAWGKQWQGRLDEALGQAQFLIPIVTPSYFKSRPCRDELEKFVALERKANRSDLILPLYFRTIQGFNTSHDPLVQLISRRQYRDWREVRNRLLDDPKIREMIDELADELGEAIIAPSALAQTTAGPAVIGPHSEAAVATQRVPVAPTDLSELRGRVDKLEEQRTEHEATISALRSARTTLQEELQEARGEGSHNPDAPEAGQRLRWLTTASVLAVGLVIGGFWLATRIGDELPDEGEIDRLKAEINRLESRASAAEGGTAALESRLAAERRDKQQLQRQLAAALTSDHAAVAPASGPLEPWRDCEECPWMISLSGGTVMLGSPEDEEGRALDEGPQHEVQVLPFAIGLYEVTFDDWDACVEDGQCTHLPDDRGWGRGHRPVINVNWHDAQEYVAWLNGKTGKLYRLPSEAEWEYAARTGTTTPFWNGATISTEQANYNGTYKYGPGWKGQYRQQTMPVGSFEANPWGLHDMHGNVWEWVEDCWNDGYQGGPTDGAAWLEGNCSMRAVRGGSWYYEPWHLRSASRLKLKQDVRFNDTGFRVARQVAP